MSINNISSKTKSRCIVCKSLLSKKEKHYEDMHNVYVYFIVIAKWIHTGGFKNVELLYVNYNLLNN